ncbi:hypothetical protein [Marinifilum caeruleilacunae]|uniref:Uncharacterized protein n=1 Tax=Marinifilum caeruleilacunae TaxID=2499076 RepID=A0ABX1WU32_9BACT|nr:hypothetical protein [Marinifilum caeruleilacunae]NOU59610.1 hypothetical protein [Marinifilum caeruleilacunae]
MKRKIHMLLLLSVTLAVSCTPEDYVIKDNIVDQNEVKIIKLTSDHRTLLPGEYNRMQFRAQAYGIKELVHNVFNEDDSTYSEELKQDTFLIPHDQLPKGFIKIVDENGEELDKGIFRTPENAANTYTFYAKTESIESEPLSIEIREPLQANYNEIVIPLVFHIMQPPANSGSTYTVSLEKLQEKVNELNDVFNFKVSTNPNGASAKITFKLAEYGPNGKLLETKGKNLVQLSENLKGIDCFNYINTYLLWDPNKYLNVWVAGYSSQWSSDATSSIMAPNVIAPGFYAIPGLITRQVNNYGLSQVQDFSEIGILYEMTEFINPNSTYTHDILEFSTIMGKYLGLLPMVYHEYYNWMTGTFVNNLVDGDTDYCEDTYVYKTRIPVSIYKQSYVENIDFTTFNIMCSYSRKNSITADQVKRIRAVLEACPSRWAYKSDWAFTGK